MDLIERVRQLNQSLLDRVAPQRVVFHHVPKCGGTSVARALRRRYLTSQATVRPEPSFRAYQTFTGRADTEGMASDVDDLRKQMMLYLLHDDVRCVSLHAPFSGRAFDQFNSSYKFITILREPISRFVSHYNWSSHRPEAHGYIKEDFDTFLETERAQSLGSEFVEFFADLPCSYDKRGAEAIKTAIANLRRLDAVGRLDNLPAFSRDLQSVLGIKINFGHENRTHRGANLVSANALTDRQKAIIHDICAPDIAVWESLFRES
ncbi:MAG: sulfotransferase family 2 domain-containing protein [Sulfitobacter sp.]|nr:sulfotransferase family 2 domain-containing protein [Sulfitobacter sp.]